MTTGSPVRVCVEAERELARRLLERVLEQSGAEIVEPSDADVIVLVDPVAQQWTRARAVDRPVIVLSETPLQGAHLLDAVEHGAVGVLSSRCESDEFVAALRRVAEGDVALTRLQTREVCDELRQRRRTEPHQTITLTVRENQILRSIEAGELMKQTARALGISPRTVENTQRVLFRKLGVRNRAQAVARSYALGILPPHEEPR